MFSKKMVRTKALWIKLGTKWLSILRETCSKNYHLKVLTHTFEEAGYSRSHKNVNLTNLPLDFHGQNDISIFNGLELRVH